MSPAKDTQKKGKSAPAKVKASEVFSAEEKAAMREAAKERRAAGTKEEQEKAVLEKIEEMQEPDRAMARRVHAIIKANAPSLSPKLWYGMPAYARDDTVVCFFQPALKFKARYSTLGFNNDAHLDEGNFWPVAYALIELTPAEEARIIELVKKAVS